MDYRLNTLLRLYAFTNLLLQFHLRPLSAAPVPCSSYESTWRLSQQLEHDAGILLGEYEKYHGKKTDPIPEEVPPSTISGDSVSEKLQDAYARNLLFKLHVKKVEDDQVDFFGAPKPIVELLPRFEANLDNLSNRINELYPEAPSPTSPAPLELPYSDNYARIVYGQGVLVSVKDWLKQVKQVVEETKTANGC